MPKKDGELTDDELEQVVGGSKDMKILLESWRQFLNEKEEDGSKVIFMAGAPGSGKSTVINKLGLGQMEMINPDLFYEPALEKAGFGKNISKIKDEYVEVRDALTQELQKIGRLPELLDQKIIHADLVATYDAAVNNGESTPELEAARQAYDGPREKIETIGHLFAQGQKDAKKKQSEMTEMGKNFIVDGTGGRFGLIRNQKTKLEDAGYEVAMIFVDVPLDTAIARQEIRGSEGGRTLDPKAVSRSWEAVTKNKELYKELFGNNFFLVSGDEEQSELRIKRMKGKVNRFLTI
jgi:predicted ABC-type ATPase